MAGDDEDTPPTVFPSAEAAYLARERSEEASAARMRRREEALKRLGRKKTQEAARVFERRPLKSRPRR